MPLLLYELFIRVWIGRGPDQYKPNKVARKESVISGNAIPELDHLHDAFVKWKWSAAIIC